MTATKTIAVVGATGATAGGLARAILADPASGFTCRAITRTPESAPARALANLGASVVQADTDDVDSLVDAFDGAYGAFCMTSFWESLSSERETRQAANQAQAAAAAGVRHAIWSTLEDARRWYPLDDDRMPTVMGSHKVAPFEGKAEGDRHFEQAGVPTTYLLTPTHWEAFVFGLGVPQPGPDDVRIIGVPLGDTALPGIAAEDIGRCAYELFQEPQRYLSARVGIAGEHTTGQQLADGLASLFSEPVRFQPLPLETFRVLPVPGADIAANMFQFMTDVSEYAAARDVAVTRALNPRLLGFNAWVAHMRARTTFPVPSR